MRIHGDIVEQRLMLPYSRLNKWYDLLIRGWEILEKDGPKKALYKIKEYGKIEFKSIEINKRIEQFDLFSMYQQYITDLFERADCRSPEYVPLSQNHIKLAKDDIKLIAFYLPQYHPIPENDEWWGKGFTDWTNVSKAVPQFIGHYQPHLPDELGFYDLRLIEVQKRQIELARQYGIYGFCFHYYWFSGKRLLEMPLDQFLNNPELNFPFCICWANENWTRRWDGLDNEVLIAQSHSPENDNIFIKDLEPFFRDPRYIRITSKPVLIVYRAPLLPDARATTERWRTYCREHGIGEIYLIAAQTFGFEDPRKYGFDAAVEFPPLNMPEFRYDCNKIKIVNPKFAGKVFDYNSIVKSTHYKKNPPYKLYKSVMPGWDNTARRPNNASIFNDVNPSNYKEWLTKVAEWTEEMNQSEEKFIFINAWNEWAEGAHLEPDRKYGYGFLQSTSEVVKKFQNKP